MPDSDFPFDTMETPEIKRLALCLLLLLSLPVWSRAEAPKDAPAQLEAPAPRRTPLDATPQALEHQLQSLPWELFRTVVESEPKLKADVDAYGPLGWAYIQKKYRAHPWSRNLERLDLERRHQLATTIQTLMERAGDVPPEAAPVQSTTSGRQ